MTRIPINDAGYQDWDCAEAFDMAALRDALEYVQTTGVLPPTLVSKEDQNTIIPPDIPPSTLSRLHAHITSRLPVAPPKIFLLDGILLYPPNLNPSPLPYLTTKLLLTADLPTLVERRKRRGGYVTLEGFWEDPEGYVEQVVWGNWVREHGGLVGGEGEGMGVRVQPGREWGMGEVLEWAVREVLEGLVVDGGGKERGEEGKAEGKEGV